MKNYIYETNFTSFLFKVKPNNAQSVYTGCFTDDAVLDYAYTEVLLDFVSTTG